MDSSQLSLLRIFSLPNLCYEINRALESVFEESELPTDQTDIIRLYLERIIHGKANLANCMDHLNGIDKNQLNLSMLSFRNSLIGGQYKRLKKAGMVELSVSNEQSESEHFFQHQTMNPSYFSSKEISRAVVSVFNNVDLPAEQMKIIAIYLEQIICNKSSLVNWTVHLDDIDQDQLASLVLSVRNSLVCGLHKQLEKSGMVALNDSKELPELKNVASQETKQNQLDSCNPIMADNVGSRSAGHKMLHKCDHCSYASFNRNHVSQHEKTHTGEKPIKCDLCAYSTTQNSFLRAHLRSHTGEKPFKCSLCPYAAGYSSNLKVHIRSHTGEKPHKCDKCSFASSYRYRLEKHKKSHDA